MKKLFIPLLLLVVVFIAIASEPTPPPPQTSVLWENNGANWDPQTSKLRDFTSVGYMSGNAPIPDWPVGVNVTTYGAIPDDDISDVAAFRQAIANCPQYHAIRVPDGVYVIDDMIDVTKNNIVIRGDSRDGTVIYFPKHLRELFPDWTGDYAELSFINFSGGTNRGIENLSLVFRDEQKATGYYFENKPTQNDRHWFHSGENPIAFNGGETDGWMRDIYIKNANHGIRIDGLGTRQITLQNIVLDQFVGRTMLQDGTDGHMGIKLGSGVQHCLVHNILLTGRWDHDITPMGAKNNVFSRITGPNIELDHHAMGNSGNLFTEVDTGIGGRGYGEAINNYNETYWGIKGIREAIYLPATSKSVMVGIRTSQLSDIGADYHHETIDPDALTPANIYLAQLARLQKNLPSDQVLTLPPHPAGVPLRLHSIDDAKVEGGTSENNNYAFDTTMALKNGGGTTDRQAFMKFDLGGSGLTNVASAKLRIYVNGIGNSPFGLEVREVGDDTWTETTLTYLNKPTGGAVAASTLLNASNSWYELDLTAYVNSQLALSDSTISIQLKGGAAGANSDAFTSIQSAEGGNAAELVIHADSATVAPPAAPTGLTAAPNDNRVTLDWNDNADADIASYNVYRHAGDGTFVIEAMGLTTSAYEDLVVSNGSTYTYRVKAVDTAGTESPGVEITATPVDLTPPAAPTGVGAIADDSTSVSLYWDANSEEDLASYKVYRTTVSGNYGEVALAQGLKNNFYEDTTVANGITYYYVVEAVDLSGNTSDKSIEVSNTAGVIAQTVLLGGDIGTVGNWDNGLPTSPANRGLIATNGTVAVTFAGTYYIIQTAGIVTQSGVGSDPRLVGGSFTQNGGTWGSSGGRGFRTESGNLTTLKSGSIISGSNGNTQISASTLLVNGGTLRQYGSRSILLTGGSTLTINGGSVISAGGFGIQSLASGDNTIRLNGGTVTVNTISFGRNNSGSQLTVHIGGTTAGSFTAANFATLSSFELVTERAINWLPGSLMSFTVTGADEWAAAEWAAGRLKYDGQGTAELGSWAAVTTTGGLGDGYRFAYDSATETLVVTSLPSNSPPVASDSTAVVDEDGSVAITLVATDANSDPLTYTVVAGPANGSLSGTAPNLTYTPNANFNGADSFTFKANDDALDSNTATISITVNAVNDAPEAFNGSATTNEDSAVAVTLTATDIDSAIQGYTVVGAPANGTLSGTAPNLSYTPAANFNGADSFTFKANDGTVDSALATISITVTPVNDAPVAIAQSVIIEEDTAETISLACIDVDLDALTYSIVTPPTNGTLSGTAPNVTYTPTADFNGSDSFTFKANDGTVDSALATVSITVNAVNDLPVFTFNPIIAAGASEGVAYTGQTLAGQATDVDAGNTITYSKVSGPAWLTIESNGALSGTPALGSAGLNSFVVRATDSDSATADTTLEITVTGLPLPWVSADIGTGMLAGSAIYNAGTFTQAGSGIVGSTSDKLRFTYQTLTGDGEIIAKITALQNTGSSSRVGVMIRDTLAANSKEIFMGMTGSNAYRWVRRTATGGTTASSNSSTGTVPNTWVRLVRSGTTITAYKSSNGTIWTTVGSTTGTTFASTCYIGLAVGSGSGTTLNTSQFSNVSVIP